MSENFSPSPESRKPFKDTIPFTTGDQGRFSIIEQFSADSRYILKIVSANSMQLAEGYSGESSIEKMNNIIKKIKASELGQYLPAVQIVVGEDQQGDKQLYMACDKIVGRTLSQLGGELSKKNEQDLDSLLAANSALYLDTFDADTGTGYTLDMFGFTSNVMVGKNVATAEEEDAVHFVDVFPLFRLAPDHLIESYSAPQRYMENNQIATPQLDASLEKIDALSRSLG